MRNRTKKNFKLSSNVLEAIHKHADEGDDESCPSLFLKVKEVERDKSRYWLILEEESGEEIWAMFSLLLTQKVLIQKLMIKPIIKLKHYYLHKFEAKNFFDNPLEAYINVIGINEIEILDGRVLKKISKEMTLQPNIKQMFPRRKRKKKRPEPELESTDDSDSNSDFEKNITEKQITLADEINDVLKPKNIIRPSENEVSDERNGKSKAKNAVQSSENRSSNVRNNTSQPENSVQPSENKNPNVQLTFIVPESFVGNGRTAILISSLTSSKHSPLIRGCIKFFGAITVSARGCSYRRCRLKDSSGEISCVIFEPICTTINSFLRIGAILEIENAIVDEIPTSMLGNNEKYKLNFRELTKVALYHDNTCVYENPPKPTATILPSINNSNTKYKLLQNVKGSIRSVDRVDAIGVLIWVSQLLDIKSNNRRVKCRNIRIQDESGSALISLWENMADNFNFSIGSIISARSARLKLVRDDVELVIDHKARISLAEDCEEKTRLKKWYQPAARRMIPKI